MPSIDILSDAKNNILMLPIEREDVIPLINHYYSSSWANNEYIIRFQYCKIESRSLK